MANPRSTTSTTPTAPVLGSPAVGASTSEPVDPAEPGTAQALADLDKAMLEEEGRFTTEQNAVTAAATAGLPVTPDINSSRDEAMINAASGRPVIPTAVDFDDPARRPAVLGGSAFGVASAWNGIPTRFTLAHPLMHNQALLKEGQVVEFNVNPIMTIDPLTNLPTPTGQFVGSGGPDDQSEHVAYLYQQGMFAGTTPSDVRTGRQAAVDAERGALEATRIGADESGNPIIQPPMRSLQQPTGDMMERRLREHRGIASPATMRAAERMASSAGAEAPGSSGPRGPRKE